ncbi:MAG: hypothetical protein K9J83_01985 [Desulfarculaceae bacterium]|nr:hypothetical protein [Desulfarculaceae bacterium]
MIRFMGLLSAIRNYLEKAKEEAQQSYAMENGPECGNTDSDLPVQWTGVDLDGTLAYHEPGDSIVEIGEPVPAMMERVRKMIDNGERIKIFTARACDPGQAALIRKWLKRQGLPDLEITNIKDYNMIRLFDDRAIQVEANTGRLITRGDCSKKSGAPKR